MPRSLWLSLVIWLVEVLFVAALVSDEWLRSVQRAEDAMIVQYLGKEKDAEVQRAAKDWFQTLFVRTGIQDSIWHYFIPTEAERLGSTGFEDVGRDHLFPFIAARLQVLWDSVYQTMRRFFLLLSWWPFLLAAIAPFAVDGLAQRKIKQSNFDYSSPLAHRYSLYAILGMFYVLLIGLTLPFPIPPQAVPIAWIGVAVALNVYLAHTQKRI
jgi:hypothetical protein